MQGACLASFGLAIAFVAPGIVGLWGISQHVRTVQEWFGATAQTEATGAGFLFVFLASLAVGLFISGLRQEILDGWVFRKLLDIERPPVDEAKLTEPGVLSAVRFVSDNLYRYYQFYANMLFAMAFTYVAWILGDWRWSWWRAAGVAALLIAMVVLFLSAKYSLTRYHKALGEILG